MQNLLLTLLPSTQRWSSGLASTECWQLWGCHVIALQSQVLLSEQLRQGTIHCPGKQQRGVSILSVFLWVTLLLWSEWHVLKPFIMWVFLKLNLSLPFEETFLFLHSFAFSKHGRFCFFWKSCECSNLTVACEFISQFTLPFSHQLVLSQQRG